MIWHVYSDWFSPQLPVMFLFSKFFKGSPTFGEIFNAARDCSDIVDHLPEAKDGFYWISLPKGNVHKVIF